MERTRETGYEKVPHAIFMNGSQHSKTYTCKADAEIELKLLRATSIFKPNCFSVQEVKEIKEAM